MRGKGRKNLIPSFDLHVKNSLVEQQELRVHGLGTENYKRMLIEVLTCIFCMSTTLTGESFLSTKMVKTGKKNAAKNTYQFTKALPGACSMPYIKH